MGEFVSRQTGNQSFSSNCAVRVVLSLDPFGVDTCVRQVLQKGDRVKSWKNGKAYSQTLRQGEVAAAGAPQGQSSGAGAQPEQPVCE
jgi:hypothetical protein